MDIQEIFDYYKNKTYNQDILVDMLREVQEIMGCIPDDVQKQISELFHIKEAVVTSVIKLYPSLKTASYRHRITICTGGRCAGSGSLELLESVKKELKIKDDGMSEDQNFFLDKRNCFKSCKTAPNLMIDQDFYQFVQPSQIPEILTKYQEK